MRIEKKIFERIKEYDVITIFGHVMPDGDCYGSEIGLREAIRATFPNKKVFALGSGLPNMFNRLTTMDEVDDETISNSLAIVVDVANTERVEDQRFHLAKDIIKIDHHIFVHKFGSLELVDNNAIAAAQIITRIIRLNHMNLSTLGAEALILGIITDSGRFQYGLTSDKTFLEAQFLMKHGVNLRSLYDTLYAVELKDVKFKGFFLNSFETKERVAFMKIPFADSVKLSVSPDYAASQVNLMAGIKGYPIWASFAEKENGEIRCELRSKSPEYNVQLVAKKYGGGGHIQASGCRVLSFEEVDKIIEDLELLAKGEFNYVE